MNHTLFVFLYLVVMGGIIVALDVLFLRDHFWIRLGTNVGIVVLFALLYVLVFKNAFK